MFLMPLCMVALEAQTTLQCVNPPYVLEWALQIFMPQSSQCCGYLFLSIYHMSFPMNNHECGLLLGNCRVSSLPYDCINYWTRNYHTRMRPFEVLRNFCKWFKLISILIRVWQSEFPILIFFTISNFLRQWNVYICYINCKPWWSKFKERNILMIFLFNKIQQHILIFTAFKNTSVWIYLETLNKYTTMSSAYSIIMQGSPKPKKHNLLTLHFVFKV